VRVLACSVGDARTSSSLSPYVPVKLACCLLSSDFTEDQSLLPAFQSWKVFQSSSSDASCWCAPGARAWLPIMLVSGSWIDKFCFAACMVLSAFLLCVLYLLVALLANLLRHCHCFIPDLESDEDEARRTRRTEDEGGEGEHKGPG
jgi:hypothetical protein